MKYFKQTQQENNTSEFDNYFTNSHDSPAQTTPPLKLKKRKMPIYMMVRKNY